MRDIKPATYKLTVHINDQVCEVKASNNETLLVSMERAGLSVPSSCLIRWFFYQITRKTNQIPFFQHFII